VLVEDEALGIGDRDADRDGGRALTERVRVDEMRSRVDGGLGRSVEVDQR
jgi:hypothetical protein